MGSGGVALGAGAAVLLPACTKAGEPVRLTSAPTRRKDEVDDAISPPEDLMREHGVLDRILLVYEEGLRRMGTDARPEVIARGADIIRRFIEQYHEKLEEDFLFPRFEKAGVLPDLVATLRSQHAAGRRLTGVILENANPRAIADEASRDRLSEAMRRFIRMYRPHEAREDTVLFPAFRTIVRPDELAALGEQFEAKEVELFGKAGFTGVVQQVATLERMLGIYDLDQFTPAAVPM